MKCKFLYLQQLYLPEIIMALRKKIAPGLINSLIESYLIKSLIK